MSWVITELSKPQKYEGGVLLVGLPGIGNAGKLAMDFIIEQLRPVPLYDFYSHSMPHSVFVNKHNLVELPKIQLFGLRKPRRQPMLFLAGDIQPIDEVSSHEFAEACLELLKKIGVRAVLTMGGIGMATIPKTPKIYITGSTKEAIEEFSTPETKKNIAGVVGPIIGLTGLLVGLAKKHNIPAATYLVESFAHPVHVGVNEARQLLHLLDSKFKLGINLKKFDESVRELEQEVRLRLSELNPKPRLPKDASYIG